MLWVIVLIQILLILLLELGLYPSLDLLLDRLIDRPVWREVGRLLGRFICLLGQTGDDLDLLGVELVLVVHLEVDVLDEEGPDFVAEAVGVEVALFTFSNSSAVLAGGVRFSLP